MHARAAHARRAQAHFKKAAHEEDGASRAHRERARSHERASHAFGGGDIAQDILSYLISLQTGVDYYKSSGMTFEQWKVYSGRKRIGDLCDGNPQNCPREEAQYASLFSHQGQCRMDLIDRCRGAMSELLQTQKKWMHVVVTVAQSGEYESMLLKAGKDGAHMVPTSEHKELNEPTFTEHFAKTTRVVDDLRLVYTFVRDTWNMEDFCHKNSGYIAVPVMSLLRLRKKANGGEIKTDDCDMSNVMVVKKGDACYKVDSSMLYAVFLLDDPPTDFAPKKIAPPAESATRPTANNARATKSFKEKRRQQRRTKAKTKT